MLENWREILSVGKETQEFLEDLKEIYLIGNETQ
jgi:hypothetical protein